MRLSQIGHCIGATLEGEDVDITGIAPIAHATSGQLTFMANPAYARHLKTTRAGAVILAPDAGPSPLPCLRMDNPYMGFALALELFYSPPGWDGGIHPTAVVHPSVRLGQGVSIGPNTVIERDCIIGDHAAISANCTIYPGVTLGTGCVIHSNCSIREFCRLGDRVIVQNGACIGSDGFGYARRHDKTWHKIVQSGPVIIEDDVEIGANATIDRAAIGETRIGRGAKVDNLVQVGHGCSVGEDTLLCAQVGLAGSTRVGQRVILAGQVGSAGHLAIGDDVVATAQSGIPHSIPAARMVSGYPAIENKHWLKASALFRRLPELLKAIRELEKRLEILEKIHLK